jgi:uncharacterized membrane protein
LAWWGSAERITFADMAKPKLWMAAVLGTVAGMRAMLPMAALGLRLRRLRRARVPLALAAAGELVYDKLPVASERTALPLLAARVVNGALAGGLLFRRRDARAAIGAAVGAAAAIVSAFVTHRLRRLASQRVPPTAAAVGEDLLAAGFLTAANAGAR